MSLHQRKPVKTMIGLFASGNGSNLQAILDYELAHPEWPGQVAVVVSDKPECRAVERAQEAGIPVFARSPKVFADRTEFETEILHKLKEYKVEWLVLAGYMRLVGPTLLDAFAERIVNIHPSLLPAFPGLHAIRDALAAGASETGVTVHFVDAGMDTGPVIAQGTVKMEPGMTEETLAERIHVVEHELYPRVIGQVIEQWQGSVGRA